MSNKKKSEVTCKQCLEALHAYVAAGNKCRPVLASDFSQWFGLPPGSVTARQMRTIIDRDPDLEGE